MGNLVLVGNPIMYVLPQLPGHRTQWNLNVAASKVFHHHHVMVLVCPAPGLTLGHISKLADLSGDMQDSGDTENGHQKKESEFKIKNGKLGAPGWLS